MEYESFVRLIALCCCYGAVAKTNDTLDFRPHSLASIEDKRTNMCVTRNQSSQPDFLKNVLRGLHLNFVVIRYDPPWFDEPEGNTDQSLMKGFHASLASYLAQRAGFTYTITSHTMSSFSPDLSWTEYLGAAMTKFDMSLDWWLITPGRLQEGFKAPLAFLDLTPLLAVKADLTEPTFWENAESFSKPLTAELWLVFVVMSIATSLLFFWLEAKTDGGDVDQSQPLLAQIFHVIWVGFMRFTDGGEFTPRTVGGRILTLTFTFLILLLVAGYTANLASLLVVAPKDVICKNLDDCLKSGDKVCTYKGTAVDTYVKGAFPQIGGQLHSCVDQPWVCVNAGECDMVIQNQISYTRALRDSKTNPDCRMRDVDFGALTFLGGWMSRAEYDDKCTAILIDALAHHMAALQLEGTIRRLLNDMIDSYASKTCDATTNIQSEKFKIAAMSGPLLLHAVSFVFVLAFFCCMKVKRHRRFLQSLDVGWTRTVTCKEIARDTPPETKSLATENIVPALRSELRIAQQKLDMLLLYSEHTDKI